MVSITYKDDPLKISRPLSMYRIEKKRLLSAHKTSQWVWFHSSSPHWSRGGPFFYLITQWDMSLLILIREKPGIYHNHLECKVSFDWTQACWTIGHWIWSLLYKREKKKHMESYINKKNHLALYLRMLWASTTSWPVSLSDTRFHSNAKPSRLENALPGKQMRSNSLKEHINQNNTQKAIF